MTRQGNPNRDGLQLSDYNSEYEHRIGAGSSFLSIEPAPPVTRPLPERRPHGLDSASMTDSTASPADFVTVAKEGDIPDGEGRAYAVSGRMVAVFRQGGDYTAIDDICPHAGASLASGYVEGGAVSCPWHAWRFCVREGTWLDNPKARIRQQCFAVRVVNGEIQVRTTAE